MYILFIWMYILYKCITTAILQIVHGSLVCNGISKYKNLLRKKSHCPRKRIFKLYKFVHTYIYILTLKSYIRITVCYVCYMATCVFGL